MEIACACRLWTIAAGVDRTTAAARELRIKEVRNMVGYRNWWYKREESSIGVISLGDCAPVVGSMCNWRFELCTETLPGGKSKS